MKTGSDTPETDRNASPIIGFWSCATVPADFARKMERSRDEARDAWEEATEERGALRNLLTIALQHGLTDQVRAEAREMLKRPNDH